MAPTEPARTTIYRTRIRRGRVAGLVVAFVAVVAALGYRSPASSSFFRVTPTLHGASHQPRDAPLGEADGAVPDGATVFDSDVPGVGKLDPALLGALRRAATDAEVGGIEFRVDSGWRSPEYQEHLLREAVSKYGSEEEAARWVATPNTSAHVSGDAVDIGPSGAATWLSDHGAAYGLCRIYGNEPWHFELRPEAAANGCPPMYEDPTHDPRMHS